MYTVIALQIANSLNIRQCKQKLALPILFSDSDELFLANGDQKYIYLFQYGVVTFFNHNTTEINRLIAQLNPEATPWEEQELSETIKVVIQKGTQQVTFDEVILPDFDQEAIRLVLLNTSQSVALDKYLEITDSLLEETNG